MQKPITARQRAGLLKVIDTFLARVYKATSREEVTVGFDIVLATIELTLGYVPDYLTLDNLQTFRDNLAQQGTIEDN